MPLFRYQAVTASGKGVKGVIDADSLLVAKERLRKEQVLVVKVAPLKDKQKTLALGSELLLSFTKELGGLLRAGLPLYESLLTIEEKHQKSPAHPLFLDLCDHLKSGGTLSSVLKKYPATFDQVYLAMVQVGEESGDLSLVFEQLKELIVRQQKLKKQLSSALMYPAFLASFCGLIVLALLFFIIPSMSDLFEGRAVHPVTGMVLSISAWVNTYATELFLGACTLVLALIGGFRYPPVRVWVSSKLLSLPFVKTLLVHAALMRFCRALAMLLSSGVPLLQSLKLSRQVVKNVWMQEAISQVEERLLQGEPLSHSLKNAAFIPPLVVRMLALSEETGQMQEAFTSLAEIYDEELQKHLTQLSTYLQPALLILLGAVVGLVVLSILLPLTDVSSFTASG